MVAIVTASARLGDTLQYNEKKVEEGKAYLLHSNNFLQDTHRLTYEDKLERFQRLHELNPRSEVNTVHITLNFAAQDQLSRQQLTEIADKYMKGVHMDKQPYLVYEHKDAAHAHLHIVSSLIKPEGERMRTHNLGKTHSEAVRKELEAEYHLTPADGRKHQDPRLGLVTDKIGHDVERVTRDYRFSNLQEYAAALRTHHIALGGGSESAQGQRKGLYYSTTDDQGKKNSPPLMGSQVGAFATLDEVQKQFVKGQETPNADIGMVKQAIDWAVREKPRDGFEFVRAIHEQGISMVMDQDKASGKFRVTYVDHVHKTVIPEEKLGDKYLFQNIAQRMTQPTDRVQEQKPTETPAKKESPKTPDEKSLQKEQNPFGENFHLKRPTVLSFLMNGKAKTGPGDELDQDPDMKQRHRPKR